METLSQGGDTPFERVEVCVDQAQIGEVIGRYEVHRGLGQGGMGRVYLARDRILGRSVALKLIRSDRVSLANTTRFVAEARAIASLNHPNVVQLYDVGLHNGFPWLALEYIDGETLEARCKREPASLDETLRALRAIASALGHAHGQGIVHCDLKPSNVMVGRDGRLRVVDFGLARTAAVDVTIAGTPGWMAPEQCRGEPATDRADTWALAMLGYKMLGGASKTDLPDVLTSMIARSLEANAQLRPSALEWISMLDDLIDGRGVLTGNDAPYRGLGKFDEVHARYFYGRDAEIDAFLERLRGDSLLPVVGPSGAGKSSFVFAGVIPRLRARGGWTIVSLRPGLDPLGALARGVLEAGSGMGTNVNERNALADDLRTTPTLLAARLATLSTATNGQILLVVDQMEEVFTQGASIAEVTTFLRLLFIAAEDPLTPVRIVLTVRDDFVGQVSGLQSLFVLKRLDPHELRAAITRPLERFGYRFEDDALIEAMLHELGDTSAELSVLQFACRALWEARDQEARVVTCAAYKQIGGIVGALGRHATNVLNELSSAELRAARPLLLSLVSGTTRRQTERRRLVARFPEATSILDRLIAARLVVQRTLPTTGDLIIEFAHESLLRSWTQLAKWVDESHEERRLLDDLDEAAALWTRRGRREEDLLGVDEFAAIRHRIAQLQLEVNASIEEFLGASRLRLDRGRRRARVRWSGIAALGLAITLGSIYVAVEFRAQKLAAENASANLGRFDLSLRPYDWIDGARVSVAIDELPELNWRLHERSAESEHEPGRSIDYAHVQHLAAAGTELLDRIDVRGGQAFLRIDGRGRRGERCGPSWVRLQQLPGFADRAGPVRTFEIDVPTCQASRANTVVIPPGEFVYGGVGEPATVPSYAEPEAVVMLAEFSIDRTEVSNARFAPFAALQNLTGYEAPSYPLDHSGDADMPVASVNAFQAEAFCRFMGRRLPSDYEWVKAARGGLTLEGKPNPWPRRLYPWGIESRVCPNIAGTDDGHEWIAPVDQLACTASPYGILQMVGNVAEWISRRGQTDQRTQMREVRGGDAESPEERDEATTVFRNARRRADSTFTIGVRCVGDGPSDLLTWNGF